MARDEHLAFSLSDVAAEANVSTATVYRYFHSIDEAVDAYLAGFVSDVRRVRNARQPEERMGVRGLRTLGDDWIDLIAQWGPALVHIRSPVGFLDRYRGGDPTVLAVSEFVLGPIQTALDELGYEARDVEYALLLWNAMFDQREVLDLERQLGWSPTLVSRRLTDSFIAAMTANARRRRSPRRAAS